MLGFSRPCELFQTTPYTYLVAHLVAAFLKSRRKVVEKLCEYLVCICEWGWEGGEEERRGGEERGGRGNE